MIERQRIVDAVLAGAQTGQASERRGRRNPELAQWQCEGMGSRCLDGSQLWMASGVNGTLGRARIGSGHTERLHRAVP
jgi:hypothetical protein